MGAVIQPSGPGHHLTRALRRWAARTSGLETIRSTAAAADSVLC